MTDREGCFSGALRRKLGDAANDPAYTFTEPLDSGSQGDFYFVEADDPEAAANAAVRICAERIPARFGLRPIQGTFRCCVP